jgi:hypothetical protein
MAARKAFPRDIDLFSDDKRIAYYEDDEKYILEDEDGAEWEFLTESSRWVPTVRSRSSTNPQSRQAPRIAIATRPHDL